MICLSFFPGCSGILNTDCPMYVSEGVSLRCDCMYTPSASVPPGTLNIQWINYSATSQLLVDNVSRSMNGRNYTCQVSLDGTVSTLVYTLRVACKYGHKSMRYRSMRLTLSRVRRMTRWLKG
jgi:hypothetical protein